MYERARKDWSKHWDFILLDVISLEVAFVLAYLIRFQNLKIFSLYVYRFLFLIAPIVDFGLIIIFSRFSGVLRRGLWVEFKTSIKHMLCVFAFIVFVLFVLKISSNFSRLFIFFYIGLYFAAAFSTRLLRKKNLRNKRGKNARRSLAIVTTSDNIQNIIDKIEDNNFEGYFISAIVLKDYVGDNYNGILCLKDRFALIEYCLSHWVDEVFVELEYGEMMDIEFISSLETMGISIHISNLYYHQYGYKIISEQLAKIPVLTITNNFMSASQQLEKRMLDVAGGLVGSLITLILIVIFGPIIKIKSPGPVFFKQTRVGKNGKTFEMIKFRSMYLDAEERKKELMGQNRISDGMMFKMEFDPRVIGNYIDEKGNRHTGVGEFIRKYSIDEFPQFFNVLAGDMSLVGTRPPTLDEYSKYKEHHKARLSVKPGITGMWQVSGRSNIVDFEEVVKLDTEYINDWSFGKDIKILLKTIKVVFSKEGSM